MGFCTKSNHQHSNRLRLPECHFSISGKEASQEVQLQEQQILIDY